MRGAWLLPVGSALVISAGVVTVAAMQPPAVHGWSQPIPATAQSAQAEVALTDPPALPAPGGSGSSTPAFLSPARVDAQALPSAGAIEARVSREWSATVAVRTSIPERALLSYAGAALAVKTTDPGCHLGWTTLAGLGAIESGHGTHGGSSLGADGTARPAILGPELDDGDRAAGPLQFIAPTWSRWGVDANGDGIADPQNLDDSALAAAHYLCSYGDLADASRWRTAIFAYNHLTSYVDAVLARANAYADQTR